MNPRRKHVVILVENLPVPFDRRPWQIAQTLARSGRRVSIICPRMYEFTKPFERLDGIDIHRYPNREGDTPIGWVLEYLNAVFWMLFICLRIFLREGIDAIHACNPPDVLWSVALPFKLFCGTRFLFDHHDLNPEVYVAKFNRKDAVYRAMCTLERMTYSLADVAMVTNESFRRIVLARDRFDGRRMYTVRNAPVAGRLKPAPGREEHKLGKKHLIGYLGVMNKQDGLDLLLESARRLVHGMGRADVMFGLIGDGPEVPMLKEMVARLKLDQNVTFLGRISDGGKLSDYLNAASVCVCPDPKNEMNDHTTQTKIVEYMSLGKPIVAYDLKESLYSAADTALYAANNDPRQFAELIEQLLNDPARAAELGARGKARYDGLLSWNRSQEQILTAYDELLGDRSDNAR